MEIPRIGLGTWQINDRERMLALIGWAYSAGYRLFDTAAAYSNEIAVGRAVQIQGLDRRQIFLSDKVWNTSRGYDAVQEACRKSLKKLKTDYMDLYLIHWPASPKLYFDWEAINADTWRGMEAVYREGLVRAIGVCNFKAHHLKALMKNADICPMVNQLELHPGMIQAETVAFCRENDIAVEASSPLGNGKILEHELLQTLAKRYGRSAAQICLRWSIQKGNIVIPKTSGRDRLHENMDIEDFELTDAEIRKIDALPYCGGLGINPDEVTEFG